jgi:maleylacetoacetate isomerase
VRYTESVAIVELLEERFPAPALYPKDAHGRARVRTLVEIVNSGIQPLQNTSVLAYLPEGAETRAKWLGHFVARGLASLERAMGMNEAEGGHGASGPFAYGDSPTAADVFLVPQVAAAKRFGIDVAPFRRVSAAFDAARGLEAFRCAAPENQPDAVASSTG